VQEDENEEEEQGGAQGEAFHHTTALAGHGWTIVCVAVVLVGVLIPHVF